MSEQQYVGFWGRVGATLIDTVILLALTLPILHMVYGAAYWDDTALVQGVWDLMLSYVLPAVAVIAFWIAKSATPGKLLMGMRIVDAKTGGKPTTGQFLLRYIGYFFAMVPLFIGVLWILIDKKKQGWHDKMASTVVVKGGDDLSEYDEVTF